MKFIEEKTESVQKKLVEMFALVRSQLVKSRQALFENDLELADEVIAADDEVDDHEHKVSQSCERILALYNPVAIDLRFILAAIKISLSLERIGDHAEGVCLYIKGAEEQIPPSRLKAFKIDKMFDKAIAMLDDVTLAMKTNDIKLARTIFKKDLSLNAAYYKSVVTGEKMIKKNPDEVGTILQLLGIVRKVERVGDATKNISEEIIFHVTGKLPKRNSSSRAKKKRP